MKKTKTKYTHHYNPNHPQRDIIWLNREDRKSLLLTLRNGKEIGMTAAIQLKVSGDGMGNILRRVSQAQYGTPVVYFDLNDDFDRVRDELPKTMRSKLETQELDDEEKFRLTTFKIEEEFLRGLDIAHHIHEELLRYDYLLREVIQKRKPATELLQNELVKTAVTILIAHADRQDLLEKLDLNRIRKRPREIAAPDELLE